MKIEREAPQWLPRPQPPEYVSPSEGYVKIDQYGVQDEYYQHLKKCCDQSIDAFIECYSLAPNILILWQKDALLMRDKALFNGAVWDYAYRGCHIIDTQNMSDIGKPRAGLSTIHEPEIKNQIKLFPKKRRKY